MKKNIFSKIAAIVATTAMAVCAIVATPSVAKADTAIDTKLVVYVSDATKIDALHLEVKQDGTISSDAATSNALGWGDLYVMTQDSSDATKFTIDLEGNFGTWCDLQIVLVKGTSGQDGLKIKLKDVAGYDTADALYVSIDSTSSATWAEVTSTVTTSDPRAAKASDIIAAIDAIGTVAYTDESLAKIVTAENAYAAFTGNKSDVTNYSTLTAARAKYDELKAAAMGEVIIYVKNADWTEAYGYVWGDSELLGSWAGTKLEKDAKNSDWFVCKATITDANNNFIFNSGSEQTGDLKVTAKGTYWITLTADTLDTATLSTTAPTGWVGEVTNTTDDEDTADMAPVVAMVAVAALAAAVVLKKKTVEE